MATPSPVFHPLQSSDPPPQAALFWRDLLAATALRIQQSSDLAAIWPPTLDDLRQGLGCDRTFIYQFHPTSTAHPSEEPSQAQDVSSIVEGAPSASPALPPGTVVALSPVAQIGLAVQPFPMAACLMVPIAYGEEPWGLLGAQRATPSTPWQAWEQALLQQLSIHLSMALQKVELVEQLEAACTARQQAEAARQPCQEGLQPCQRRSTSRGLADAALTENERRFQQLVEQTNDWVWEVNTDFVYTYTNPQIKAISGYDPSEILGRRAVDFMPSDAAIRFTTVLQHFINQQAPFDHVEQTLQHQSGHAIVLETSGTPVFDQLGQWKGYWGMSRDISERKQVELDIRRALTKERELGELKNRFISMASHEFRTPLTTIMASAESLEHYRHRWPEDKIVAYLRRIQKTAAHMNGLLHDVLTVGRVNAGHSECKPHPLSLLDFCRDLVREVELGGAGKVQFVYQGEAAIVLADEKLLRQILGNLLSNALKYSPIGSQPRFQVTYGQPNSVFVVADQGIGIPADDMNRLFEPFHRAANVGTIPGTGLGLAIVQNSVAAHGGTIRVESGEQSGTTFEVSLPLIGASTDDEKNSGD